MTLTNKQELFVQELVKGKSQREAYKIAYDVGSMSDSVIDVKACELMKNGKVAVRYEELQARLVKESEDECIVNAKDVLREYAKLGFSNITDYLKVVSEPFEVDGKELTTQVVQIFNTDSIERTKLDAVAEIKQTKEGISLKLHDKKGALDSMARVLGMFVDKVDVKSEVVNRHEYHIEQTITSDPESAELLKQLYKRSLIASVGDSSKA